MKLFAHYLGDHKKGLLLWCAFFFLNFFVGFLYRVPAERAWLWAALCGTIGSIVGGCDFLQYKSRHQKMEILQKQLCLALDQIPTPKSLPEQDDYALLAQSHAREKAAKTAAQQNERDSLDYYTMWVHQIKVPIAALRLILQEEDSAAADEMKLQVFKIEQYVSLVLEYLRLESPSTDFLFREVPLDDVICEAVKKYAPLFIRQHLPFHYETVQTHVLTDPKWLVFVLEQILSNSLKYTKIGGITVYMQDEMTLVIEDTGIGIRAEDLPRIGERSFTGCTGRQDKSASGLGLYLCKTILSKLGHDFHLESIPGKGTKVFIRFQPTPAVAE